MWGSWYLLGSRDGRVITSLNAGMPRNIPYLCFGDARLALGVETVVVPVFCPVVGPVIVRAVDEGDVVVEIVVVEARLAGDARQILAEPLRRALEAAEQPLAPAKPAHAASILSPSRAVRRTGTMLPGSAGVVSVSAAR